MERKARTEGYIPPCPAIMANCDLPEYLEKQIGKEGFHDRQVVPV
jgi:hypothetical protein